MLTVGTDAPLDDLLRLNRVVHAWHTAAYPGLFRTDAEEELRRYFSAALSNPQMRHFVAQDDGRAVGFVQVEHRELRASPFRKAAQVLYVNIIVVDTPWQHKGVGRALVERVRAHARELGISRIELDHWEGNPAARFFHAMGFRPYRHYLFATEPAPRADKE
jgi:GNAT superfamily N-acetyltransferase